MTLAGARASSAKNQRVNNEILARQFGRMLRREGSKVSMGRQPTLLRSINLGRSDGRTTAALTSVGGTGPGSARRRR